jgi:protein-disulfide isomerase
MKSLALILVLAVAALGQQPAPSGKTIGLAVAKVTVEVFSDYQCPHCKEFYEKTLKPLIGEYARHNKIYFIHREFPLPGHQYAKEAACLACAAERVGKYEQVCDALFRDQDSWGKSGKVADTACSALSPAEAKRVRVLAHDPAVIAEVDHDIALGQNLKLGGTPAMFIKSAGQSYPAGAVSYPVLRRVVEQLLSR